ncbi:hypothetical protein GCM10009775_33190 [Microbacterium aoyamense]|uniref:Uncharacterized protein n=1 Tax=Microbacterium aoyamense TaxID=344166 RepID=A0ABN2PYN9_9MICO|nr:DUF6804 family protein [Microbacterium aoyamense]
MSKPKREPSPYQRNALAPSLVAAAVLFLAPVLLNNGWAALVLFVVSILAVIIGWFAIQARQWWWLPVFLAIAVIWNPVLPFPFAGIVWTIAQPVAALVFLAAGALIKIRRP